MPPREYFIEQIEKEFALARAAQANGNEGMARVCARRAAGHALTWLRTKHAREEWGTDAIRQLNGLKEDASFPVEVREAAMRLTTKISDRFVYPFTTQPVGDAQIIVSYVRDRME